MTAPVFPWNEIGRPSGELLTILSGSGDPNGVRTSLLGTLFQQQDATYGLKVWFNRDGSDTWRNLKSDDGALCVLDYLAPGGDLTDPDDVTAMMRRAVDATPAGAQLVCPPIPGGYTMRELAAPVAALGTVTISGGSGAASFSHSETMENGWLVKIGSAKYELSEWDNTAHTGRLFDPTPGAFAWAPNHSATAFDIVRTEIVLITKPIRLTGATKSGVQFYVSDDTPVTVNGFRQAWKDDEMAGWAYEDFAVLPVTPNTGGRYGFVFDCGNGYHTLGSFKNVWLGEFTDYSFVVSNRAVQYDSGAPATPTRRTDGFFNVDMTNLAVYGGAKLDGIGDSWRWNHNEMTGPRDLYIATVTSSTDTAHLSEVRQCNITCAGGVVIDFGNAIRIENNNMEAVDPSTSTNSAMIDIRGSSTNPVTNCIVRGNFIGGGSGNVSYCVRVDYGIGVVFERNLVGPGAAPNLSYWWTAHAIAPTVLYDMLFPWGITMDGQVRDDGAIGPVMHWVAPGGTGNTRALYLSHHANNTNTVIRAEGFAQTNGSIIDGVVPAKYTAVNVTATATHASLYAGTIAVSALSGPIPAYTTLLFAGTKPAFTLAPALAGDTSLLVDTLSLGVTSGDVAAWSGVLDYIVHGYWRVFKGGNVRVGFGGDAGTPFQVYGSSFFDGVVTINQRLNFTKARQIAFTDNNGQVDDVLSVLSDDIVRIGFHDAPTGHSRTASIYFLVNGTEVGRFTSATFQLASSLTFATNAGKIIPGATSLSVRNHGDTQNNLLVVDAGDVSSFRDLISGRNLLLPSGGIVKVNATQVLSARRTGWDVFTGSTQRGDMGSFGGTASVTYDASQIQDMLNAIGVSFGVITAVVDDLAAHGIIGP